MVGKGWIIGMVGLVGIVGMVGKVEMVVFVRRIGAVKLACIVGKDFFIKGLIGETAIKKHWG